MTAYTAPIKDVQFIIRELTDLDEIIKLPGVDPTSGDLMEAILDEAGRLTSEVIAPLNKSGDKEGARLENGSVHSPNGFKEAYRLYIDGGWQALPFAPEDGGQGLPFLFATAANEFCLSANMAWSLCMMLTEGAVFLLKTHASKHIQDLYLPKIIPGEWSATMNLTEAQAGTDLALLKTRAIPDGDHYLITGQKIFITWGDHDMTENIVHLVLARLPDAPEGIKGISLFLVPKYLVNPDGSLGKRNDVKVISLEHKLGIHASPTCVMSYGDNDGAVGYLVGEEHNGLACMFTLMNHARFGVGLQGHSICARAYQKALEYAKERVQGKKQGLKGHVTIIHHPDVRRMLMVMKSCIEAMRTLCYVTATSFDYIHRSNDKNLRIKHERRLSLLTPVVKGWCTELSQEVTSLGIQIHGGMGFIEETGVAQFYRDIRISTIYEGTTSIQALDLVHRKILRDGGRALAELISEMTIDGEELARINDNNLKVISRQFQAALNSLKQATEWLLGNAEPDVGTPAAISNNLLMLIGTVCGGWQLTRSAMKAHGRLKAGENDQEFYETKITTARFFAEHLLPQSSYYLQVIQSGSESIMALDENNF